MFKKSFSLTNQLRSPNAISSNFIDRNDLEKQYGSYAKICPLKINDNIFVFSKNKEFDLIELEQLLQSVGWSRRPLRRVKRALDNSLLKVGLWSHDKKFPRLIGFARCTGDGMLEATVWDVAVSPVYQGSGLGKLVMEYVLQSLGEMGLERVTLFADPGVISFYQKQGWILEPNSHRCAFWYAN